MHWSPNWRQWIVEAARIAAPNTRVLVTCTFKLPRGRIEPAKLAAAMKESFDIEGYGQLVPPVAVGGGHVAMSYRFFATGRRKMTAHQRAKRRKKK